MVRTIGVWAACMVWAACVVWAGTLAGCSASAEPTELRSAAKNVQNARDGGASPEDAGVASDETEGVRGVPDRSRDPAVVALGIDGEVTCSATLISPRIVLTARRCLARTVSTVSCPAPGVQVLAERKPETIAVLVGDDAASAHEVARGEAIVAPAGVTLCDADVGLLLVDPPVKVVKPAPVRATGPARGDRVRTVGYGALDGEGPTGIKLVREHVKVLSVSAAEFIVGESTCRGAPGGPALDEATGEILGVVTREGSSCEGPDAHNAYTRVDAFRWLVDEAFARVAGLSHDEDAGAPSTAPPTGSKSKPPTDVGGPCDTAADCAAGMCLSDAAGKYCSRACGTGDRCPNGFHCKKVGASSACVDVR